MHNSPSVSVNCRNAFFNSLYAVSIPFPNTWDWILSGIMVTTSPPLGVFATTNYGVKSLPIIEVDTNKHYDGTIPWPTILTE